MLPLVALKMAVEKKASPARDFVGALTANRINVIAELKKEISFARFDPPKFQCRAIGH